MSLWTYALWGLLGALCVEALELYGAMHRAQGFPWRQPNEVPLGPYLVSVVIRVVLGAGLAAAAGAASQVTGVFGAFGAGVAAPLILEKLARAVPITTTENKPEPLRGNTSELASDEKARLGDHHGG
jgi:hypothetical protein